MNPPCDVTAKGIRINAVCPGCIETPMGDAIDPATMNEFLRDQPIGRMGLADEVAAAVLWLCSPGASFILGVALPVDGGSVGHSPKRPSFFEQKDGRRAVRAKNFLNLGHRLRYIRATPPTPDQKKFLGAFSKKHCLPSATSNLPCPRFHHATYLTACWSP